MSSQDSNLATISSFASYSNQHQSASVSHPLQPVITEPIGYHTVHIEKGIYGEVSKIVEEALELKNATDQGVSIMALVELSDLYGAIEGYLQKHHPTVAMDDLKAMSDVTKRAFRNGRRS